MEEIQPVNFKQIVDSLKWVCSDAVKRERYLKKRIEKLEKELEMAQIHRLPPAPLLAHRIMPALRPPVPIETWRAERLRKRGSTKDLGQRVESILGKTCVYLVDKQAITIFDIQMEYEQIASAKFANDAWTIFKMMIDPQDVNRAEMARETKEMMLRWLGATPGKWFVYSHGFAVLDAPVAGKLRKRLGVESGEKRPCIVIPRSTDPSKISELISYANK